MAGASTSVNGRVFEYRVRDHLKVSGYVVLRSPASRSPLDLMAARPGVVLFVQCKKHGVLGPKEWNELFDISTSAGAIPVMASKSAWRGGPLLFHLLMSRKSGARGQAQPLAPFDPLAPHCVLRNSDMIAAAERLDNAAIASEA